MVGNPAAEQSSWFTGTPTLGSDQVLGFLRDLRIDQRRSRSLNSGRNLLLEAAEAGLVEQGELDFFIAQMLELHRADLVGWTFARHDIEGDDLPHAAEFHLTERGRRRLAATEASAEGAPSLDRGSVLAEGVGPS